MKTRDVLRFIERAGKKYNEYLSACDPIAQQAQKYIDWSDVTCEFYPSDGVCLRACTKGLFGDIEETVVPATLFFETVKKQGGSMIDEFTYRTLAI